MALRIMNTKQVYIPDFVISMIDVDIEEFYVLITNQKWNKSLAEIDVSWLNKTDNDDVVIIASKKYFHKIDLQSNDNFIVQGYEYLKKLPEFEGAIDC